MTRLSILKASELGTTYMGKINQLEDKVEKLQKKYPQLRFDGFKINQSNEMEELHSQMVDLSNKYNAYRNCDQSKIY